MARDFQLVEERYRQGILEADRGVSASAADSVSMEEAHLIKGYEGGAGQALICPALVNYLSDRLQKEAAIAKERRKAREERELLKGGKKK